MSQESIPVALGNKFYDLRFTTRDVVMYEKRFESIFIAIDISKFGFDTAAKMFWVGLKDRQRDGSLIQHFEQNEKGLEDAHDFIKEFTAQFEGLNGISLLYASAMMGLVVSGWMKMPSPQNANIESAKGADIKNPAKSRKRSPRQKPKGTS